MSKSQFVQIERQNKFAEADFHQLLLILNKIKLQSLLQPQIPIEDLSARVADNIITSSATPVPNCTTCGACCAFPLCVTVKPTDQTSEPHFWKIISQEQNGEVTIDQFMRRNAEDATCVALAGNVGEDVSCQIYEERPRVCHEFEAGSDKCHALRRAYGIEPPFTNEKALEANFRVELSKAKINLSEKLLYSAIIPYPETENFIIVAILADGSRQALHVFNPNKEKWLQSEFAGLTLVEALKLIKLRCMTAQEIT